VAISDDIKDVLEEVGTALTIHRPGELPVTGWYVDPESYPDQSTLFIRMFLKSGSVAATCPIANGDIAEFNGTKYLVTNHVPTMFENDVVENILIFYRCNVLVTVETYNDSPGYDANYDKLPEWTSLGTDVPVCMVEKQLIPLPETVEDIYLTGSVTNLLYISAYYALKRGDRITSAAGNVYMIESIAEYELEGILVCGVTEDHR